MPESINRIIIDDNLRTMTIPSDIVLLGVESDDDVNKILFQMPKEYSGFDLSTFSARINYMNQHGDGDIYIVEDLEVDGDDPSKMNFTWLVGRNACMYKGETKFIVCLKKFADDDSGDVVQEFNTTVYSLPVLEGLETTEAVEQQNADIIEYILKLIQESGVIDPDDYYTKQEVDGMIPTELPNPEQLVINGQSYDGSEEVEMTIVAQSEVLTSVSGKIIHTVDAVTGAVENLEIYDDQEEQLQSAEIAVANKNLFRIDLLDNQVTSKGITFTKNADGSITVDGTSTGTYAMTSCALDKNMFAIGRTYTVSSGKVAGYSYVQLMITYTDNTVDYIVARNSSRTFTIAKEVASCTASVQITDSGVTVNNEVVYPQLELSDSPSKFVMNEYTSMTFDGTAMPVLPDAISNVWANDDLVANIVMQYEADTVLNKIDGYASKNIESGDTVVGDSITVPENGVLYLEDGEEIPDGYEETNPPAGSGAEYAQIDDSAPSMSKVYSSAKTEELVANLIDDNASGSDTTYSSQKIENLLSDSDTEQVCGIWF